MPTKFMQFMSGPNNEQDPDDSDSGYDDGAAQDPNDSDSGYDDGAAQEQGNAGEDTRDTSGAGYGEDQ